MNLLLLSVTSTIICFVVAFTLKYLSLLRWISGHAYVLSKRREHFSILEMLDLFKNVKPFPISCQKGWKIDSYANGHRIWFNFLTFPHNLNAPSIKVYAVFNQVRLSAQALLHVLKNISQSCEWKPGVISASNTHTQASLDVPASTRNLPSMPVQVDCVKEECLCRSKSRFGLQSHDSWFTENVVPTISLEYKRFWHREDNGVCWLLQMNETQQTSEFYLIQPVQEVDQCLVSIVTWSRHHSPSCVDKASVLLSSLIEYITLRKLQKTPLTTITLPQDLSGSEADSTDSGEGHESLGQDVPSLSKTRNFVLDRRSSDGNTGRSISFEKRKIELEKYSSILKYRSKFNGAPSALSTPNDVGTTTPSGLQQKGNGFTPLFVSRSPGSDQIKSVMRRSVNDGSAFGHIVKLKPESQHRQTEDDSSVVDGGSIEHRKASLVDKRESISDADLQTARYKTMNSHFASELMTETLQASNINLELSPDKQADTSGGWVFSSFDKNIVVLKKVQRPGTTVQSYIGKGFVLAPPKTVWDAVRNPRTRFTYDDTLKKVDILATIDSTLKIVYFYHESQQFLMKESCDVCVLHGERQDGQKYILTYSSIEHDKCPVYPNITRARVLPSGWIIEPAKQDKKVYSIVTYLMQIDYGRHPDNSDNLPFQEMISKYPLSIADLQQYLRPAVQMLQQKSLS